VLSVPEQNDFVLVDHPRATFALRSMEVLDDVIPTLRKMHQPVILLPRASGSRRFRGREPS
jgi:hypothetical protein